MGSATQQRRWVTCSPSDIQPPGAAIERNLGRCLWNHISLNDSEEKVNADIDDLITFELEEDDDLSKWSASEKNMMRTTLIDNAHGM